MQPLKMISMKYFEVGLQQTSDGHRGPIEGRKILKRTKEMNFNPQNRKGHLYPAGACLSRRFGDLESMESLNVYEIKYRSGCGCPGRRDPPRLSDETFQIVAFDHHTR